MVTLQATTGGALQVQGLLNVAGRRERVATVRSMNRAVSSGRTLLVSLVARATGLKSADVRKAIHTTNATIAAARAELAPSPRPIPLIKFGAKGPVPSRGKGRGVTFRAGAESGTIPNAFIATTRSGHTGVFIRVGAARKSAGAWSKNLPIKERMGPSIAQAWTPFRPQGIAKIQQAFRDNFDHEWEFAGRG